MIKIKAATILNLLVYAVLALVILTKIPDYYKQYKMQNSSAPEFNVPGLEGAAFNLASLNGKTILVFWATWCGPCTLELSRLNELVQEEKIKPDQVLAISIGEKTETVQAAVKERGYLFHVATDESGNAATSFGVRGTPTVVFVDEAKKINWMTTGLSPLLGVRARMFLN